MCAIVWWCFSRDGFVDLRVDECRLRSCSQTHLVLVGFNHPDSTPTILMCISKLASNQGGAMLC